MPKGGMCKKPSYIITHSFYTNQSIGGIYEYSKTTEEILRAQS
jgi:hypothetical protein